MRLRLPPRPPPKRRPALAAFLALAALLLVVPVTWQLARFFGDLAAQETFAYPDLGPLMQIGYCGILLTNAAIWVSVRLQALPRWSGVAFAALWLGLTFGVIPLAGTALLTHALEAHGYTECRPIGWQDRGLWVRAGHRCPVPDGQP